MRAVGDAGSTVPMAAGPVADADHAAGVRDAGRHGDVPVARNAVPDGRRGRDAVSPGDAIWWGGMAVLAAVVLYGIWREP